MSRQMASSGASQMLGPTASFRRYLQTRTYTEFAHANAKRAAQPRFGRQKVACDHSTTVRKLQEQYVTPKHSLPEEWKQAPTSTPSQRKAAPKDVSASDRTLSVIVQDRGGSVPKDAPSAQQRLKAVLTEDRQDKAAPGSGIRQGHQIVATVIYPHDEPPTPLPRAVETMLAQHFSTVTAAKKAIRRREILVAGKVCTTSRVVQPGERLEWIQRVSSGKSADKAQAPAHLKVVYEDEHMACVVKPQGMPTAQNSASGRVDVRQCLPYCLQPSREPGMLCRPQHVHRLDEATGGLLLIAKTRLGLQGLSASFEQRLVQKSYQTVVGGMLTGQGYIDIPLDGKPSLTEYRALHHSESGTHGCISTLDLFPHTGRMHQLRRHMALIGHPVLGDPKYTYGYAKRHPDAAVLLSLAEAKQAMRLPFGVAAEHQDHRVSKTRSRPGQQHFFWVSQRMTVAGKLVAVTAKPDIPSGQTTRLALQAPTSCAHSADTDGLIRRRLRDSLETQACHIDRWGSRAKSSCSSRQTTPVKQQQEWQSAAVQARPMASAAQSSFPAEQSRAVSATQHRQTAHQQDAYGSRHAGAASSSSAERHSPHSSYPEGSSPVLLSRPQHSPPAISHADSNLGSIDFNSSHNVEQKLSGLSLSQRAHDWLSKSQLEQGDSAAEFEQQLPMPLSQLLCLWAVRLVLPHPVTQQLLKLGIPDPPVFGQVRAAEQELASAAAPKMQLDFQFDSIATDNLSVEFD